MNFFRSEEHLRAWEGFSEAKGEGIIPLDELMRLFSARYFQRRMDEDYVSHMPEYGAELLDRLATLKGAGRYWSLGRVVPKLLPLARRLKLM